MLRSAAGIHSVHREDVDSLRGEDVLDLFAGTAATLVAALLEGQVIRRYYYVDNDPHALFTAYVTINWVLDEAWDGGRFEGLVNGYTFLHAFDILDVRRITDSVIGEWRPTVVVAGSPCQGFSAAQRSENLRGLQHPASALFVDAVRIMQMAIRKEPGCKYLFENVHSFVEFAEPLRQLRESLPGTDEIHCASAIAGCYRRRYFRTNVPRVGWDTPIPGEEDVRSWGGCLRKANEEAARRGSQGPFRMRRDSRRVESPRVASAHNTFPDYLRPSPEFNFTPRNYNRVGLPVVKTATFMASGADTYSMRQEGHRGGTGAGLVRSSGERGLRPPRVLAIASAMMVPAELAWVIIRGITGSSARELGALTGLTGFGEDAYRKQVGNSMHVGSLRNWWRALPGGGSFGAIEEEMASEGSHSTQEEQERLMSLEEAPGLPGYRRVDPEPQEWPGPQSGELDSEVTESEWFEHPEELELEALGETLMAHGGSYSSWRPLGKPEGEHERRPDPRDPQAPAAPDADVIRAQVREAVLALRAGQLDPASATLGDSWSQEQLNGHLVGLMEGALDGKHFQARRYQTHVEAWKELFGMMKELGFQRTELTKPQARVVKILEQGLKLQFRPVSEMFTDGRPRAAAKYRKVLRLLQQTVGHRRAAEILEGGSPSPVPIHFRNHASCEEHVDFIRKERDVFLRSGAMVRWWDLPHHITKGKPPKVVIPLAVAYSELKKKYRLCCDARYLNLWIRYQAFRFESLGDLLDLVKAMQGDGDDEVLICLSDMKSGYHHVPINDDFLTYMAVVIDGEYGVFPSMTFGMSCAVEVYCTIEGEKHRCLRYMALKLVQYIDDRASPYRSRGHALFCETWIVRLVTALGGFLSFGDLTYVDGRATFSKVQLGPLPRGEFLGFLVDTERHMVLIPEKKVRLFLGVCEELLGKQKTSARDKARFTGLVISFMPAVVPCKLFLARMFQALTGVTSWDALYETPEEERAVVSMYRDHIGEWNGTRWTRRPVRLTLCGDASVEVGAAFEVVDKAQTTVSDGGLLKATVMVHMPPHIVESGSTTREAHVCRVSVEVAVQRLGTEALRGATVVYIGDNLGMTQVMSNWYAKDPRLRAELQLLYTFCMRHGIEFAAEWRRREDPLMQLADKLGKDLAWDNSQWALCPSETRRIQARYASRAGGRWPSIDGMADPGNAKAPQFISKELTLGCAGVDFFANLGMLAGESEAGVKHLVWLNGDFSKMSKILSAVIEYRIDVILIFPMWPAAWRALLECAPVVAGPDVLPNRPRLCTPGPRVQKADCFRVRYPLASALIIWGRTRKVAQK